MPLQIKTASLLRASTPATLPFKSRDPDLVGTSSNGVLLDIDLADDVVTSWKGGAPVNGDTTSDVSARPSTATMVVVAGKTMQYAHGFKFDGITAAGTYLALPASPLAALRAQSKGYFAMALWVKLPAKTDFNTYFGIAPFLNFGNFATGTDLVTIAQYYTSKTIRVYRQTATGTADSVIISVPDALYGTWVQIGIWWDGAVLGVALRSEAGNVTAVTTASTVKNANDYSARVGQLGVGTNWWTGIGSGQENAVKFTAGRLWLEALEISGRTPTTIIAKDYTTTTAREIFA